VENNYNLIFFIYIPVLLLLIINEFKDRFEPQSKIIKLCNWSLLPSVVLIFFLISWQVIISIWYVNLFNIQNIFAYNLSISQVLKFFYYCFCLTLVYLWLHYGYRVRITEVFDFKSHHFPLVIKVCSILAVFHLIDALVTRKGPEPSAIIDFKLLDTKNIILYLFRVIVVAPILEEFIFRGLLYGPLYRKIGRYSAIIMSSLIWAYGHSLEIFPSVSIFAFGIFIIGILLAWLYDRSGSLFPPILVHMFQNSWIILYLFK